MRIITVNGRIAADVTTQLSKQGTQFISFSIANNEFGDPKSSDGKPQTQWFRVTSFQPQHMTLAQHLKKGKPITVTGKYSNQLYQSQKTGQWNISNDIIAMDIAFEIGSERQEGVQTQHSSTSVSPQKAAAQVAAAVDEIPQATSRRMSSPQVTEAPAPPSAADEDDLPF